MGINGECPFRMGKFLMSKIDRPVICTCMKFYEMSIFIPWLVLLLVVSIHGPGHELAALRPTSPTGDSRSASSIACETTAASMARSRVAW